MHQEREFSAAAKNSGLPGKFHWSLYGIYFGEREGGMFGFFSFFLPGCLGFVLVLVTWRVGKNCPAKSTEILLLSPLSLPAAQVLDR